MPLADRFRRAAVALRSLLEESDTPFMVIGGIAVITRGHQRTTRDVDASAEGARLDLDDLLRRAPAHGLRPRRPNAREFARANLVLLLIHEPTEVEVDLSIAWVPFEVEAIGRATLESFRGDLLPIATAEDLVIMKAVAFRSKDQDDLETLLVMHGDTMDLDRVRRVVAEFAEVLEVPERVGQLEALIARALP